MLEKLWCHFCTILFHFKLMLNISVYILFHRSSSLQLLPSVGSVHSGEFNLCGTAALCKKKRKRNKWLHRLNQIQRGSCISWWNVLPTRRLLQNVGDRALLNFESKHRPQRKKSKKSHHFRHRSPSNPPHQTTRAPNIPHGRLNPRTRREILCRGVRCDPSGGGWQRLSFGSHPYFTRNWRRRTAREGNFHPLAWRGKGGGGVTEEGWAARMTYCERKWGQMLCGSVKARQQMRVLKGFENALIRIKKSVSVIVFISSNYQETDLKVISASITTSYLWCYLIGFATFDIYITTAKIS